MEALYHEREMFIGPIGCDKTTLIQRLNEMKIKYNKTQTIEYYDNIITTPANTWSTGVCIQI